MNSLTDLTMTDLTILFALLIVFQLKHLLADYPLQGWPWAHWMLGKFADDPRVWVPALLGHAAVHGVSTAAICFLFGRPELCWLGGVDMGVHFVMDRIKASRRMLGRWKPVCAHTYQDNPDWKSNAFYFWALGFDQMVHHCTDYFVIWWLVS